LFLIRLANGKTRSKIQENLNVYINKIWKDQQKINGKVGAAKIKRGQILTACGLLGALTLNALYRKPSWSMLKKAMFEAIRTSRMVLFLIYGSSLFASIFALLGGARVIENFLLDLDLDW